MTGWLREDPGAMNHAATFGIFGGKPERVDPRQRDRAGAHRAGFQRHPQDAAVEPRPTEPGRGVPYGDHFRVGGGIEVAAHRIARFGDDFITQRDDRPDRNFARFRGNSGKIKRATHRRRQWKGHDRMSATASRRVCHARKARHHMSARGVLLRLVGRADFDGWDLDPFFVALHLDLWHGNIGFAGANLD